MPPLNNTPYPTLPHDPGRLLPLVRGDVGEVDGDVDDGLVEVQLVERVADDLAVAAEQEPHRDGHLALGGVVLRVRGLPGVRYGCHRYKIMLICGL